MLNAVRLQVEEESKMSLELLRKTLQVFNAAGEELSAAKQKLMLLDSAAERRLMLLSKSTTIWIAMIGIADHAQDYLGDVVYVELHEIRGKVAILVQCGSNVDCLATVFRLPPYLFNYPIRRLINVEEILAKFINEGKRKHEEIEIFIKEFRTTNELWLKERSNLLSELKIKVNEFSKIMGNVLIPENKVKGVTTRRRNMMFEATPSKEINETRINKNEPPKVKHDVQEKPHDVGVENKSSIIPERTTQPWLKSNFNDDESWYADFVNYIVGKSFHQTGHLKKERVKQVNDVTRLQALVDKKKVVITEATIRDALRLDDAEALDCLPNEEIFAELARMGFEKPLTKLTFYRAFFLSQWKFLIHTILQCMSA
nr:hypothetical protein [Tanacetum cinerariifolium]